MSTCRLLVFGQTAHANIGKVQTHEPTVVFEGPNVKLVWASWCDLIFASLAQMQERLHYRGNSLNSAQIDHVAHIGYNKEGRFFGQDLHHGVLGYVSSRIQTVTFFRTEQAIRAGLDPVWTYSLDKGSWKVSDVYLTAGGTLFLAFKTQFGAIAGYDGDHVVEMPNLAHLEAFLKSFQGHEESDRLLHETTVLGVETQQCCANAVAFTALDHNGTVYTYSHDARHPACVGREAVDDAAPSSQLQAYPIPYFSEIRIKKVVSGGYYSAAISDDDELFLWGQACPAARAKGRELRVFKSKEDDDDDFVRPVSITLEGCNVVPVDVSIGWGHILVTTRVQDPSTGTSWSAVFGAGRNERGQLGRHDDEEFLEDFVEIQEFRGKEVEQIICAGHTSYAVEKIATVSMASVASI